MARRQKKIPLVLVLLVAAALWGITRYSRPNPAAPDAAAPAADRERPAEAGSPSVARTYAPRPTQPNVIRVGAWNIEWLGVPGSRSGPARDVAQEPEDLADYILASGVDVLALAEISEVPEDGRRTNESLVAALKIVDAQTDGRWTHRIIPARTGRNQHTAIAWNAGRVELVGDIDVIVPDDRRSAQDSPLWPRPAAAARFSAGPGRTDFVVIPVHQKSNYDGSFAPHRGEEAGLLVEQLSGLRDPDVVIIGDFNTSEDKEPSIERYVAAGFTDLNAKNESTYWRGSPLDRAFTPSGQPEFAARRFEVFRDAFFALRALDDRAFKVRFSDHFMVIAEIDVAADDD